MPDATPATTPQAASANAAPGTPPAPAADPTQIRMVKEFKHDRPLYGCRIDPTGRFAFSGGQDNLVMRWELASDAKVALAGHQSWVRGMAFQPAGELLTTGDYAGRLNAWRYAADGVQPPVYSIEAHKGWVRAVAVSRYQKKV